MNDQTTPAAITDTIRQFCNRVCPGAQPVYVPVQAESGATVQQCNTNVLSKIGRAQGGRVTGWTIWVGSAMIEAECHVVWESPNGDLIDVSPKPDGEKQILFVPQPDLWDGLTRPIANKRQALKDNIFTRAMVRSNVLMDQLREEYWTVGGAKIPPEEEAKVDRMQIAIVQGVGRNEPCPCRSNKKWKQCCGKPFGAPYTNF